MSDIWDDALKFLEPFERMSRLADLRQDMRRVRENSRPKCGNCTKWMKSSECPAERNVNGYSRGPSCEGIACNQFSMCSRVIEWRDKETKRIDDELTALTSAAAGGYDVQD